jgi:hypothetical protein
LRIIGLSLPHFRSSIILGIHFHLIRISNTIHHYYLDQHRLNLTPRCRIMTQAYHQDFLHQQLILCYPIHLFHIAPRRLPKAALGTSRIRKRVKALVHLASPKHCVCPLDTAQSHHYRIGFPCLNPLLNTCHQVARTLAQSKFPPFSILTTLKVYYTHHAPSLHQNSLTQALLHAVKMYVPWNAWQTKSAGIAAI